MSKLHYVLAILGALVALAGSVFALQGLGIVGPSYSFMYQNTQWVYQGAATAAIGVVLLVLSLLARGRIRKLKE